MYIHVLFALCNVNKPTKGLTCHAPLTAFYIAVVNFILRKKDVVNSVIIVAFISFMPIHTLKNVPD